MQQTPIDGDLLIALAKWACVCIGIIAFSATTVAAIAFLKDKEHPGRTFSLLVERINALQLVTVMTVVATATLLTLLGKISPEGIVSILSGIAGYVLGGAARPRPDDGAQRDADSN